MLPARFCIRRYGDAVKYAIEDFKEYGSDYYQDFLRH